MKASLSIGNTFTDHRGILRYVNEVNPGYFRRFYIITHPDINIVRAWQGHKIEQRWFSAVQGSFKIQLIAIDDWNKPSKNSERHTFLLDAKKLDMIMVPQGYVSSIQSLEEGSKLLVMADYLLGEVNDEYRFEGDYFK